jgi:RNA polymerase sigma-70 factor, ECF subfamily
MTIMNENADSLMDNDSWLESIMSQYGEELTRIAYLYLKEWKLAEDAVQDAFIKCYVKRSYFRGESTERTWIYSILTNTCKDILRSAAYKKVLLLHKTFNPSYIPSTESAENSAIKHEEQWYLSQTVLSLPIKYREVIILFYYNGFSIKEISHLLKISESTVKVRLNRGRGKLKKCLSKGVDYYEA